MSADPASVATKSTEDVLDHHLQAFGTGDLNGILGDFTNDSVVITPDNVLRGLDQITPFFEALLAEFAKPGASFSMGQRVIDGEIAYITWSAETADNVYHLGTDTFWVRNGKVVTQTYAAKTEPKH